MNYHFTINATIKTKRTKQNLETNWSVKLICDVPCLQQNLQLNYKSPKTVESLLLRSIMANAVCSAFLCLILRLGETRVSMTNAKGGRLKKNKV